MVVNENEYTHKVILLTDGTMLYWPLVGSGCCLLEKYLSFMQGCQYHKPGTQGILCQHWIVKNIQQLPDTITSKLSLKCFR